METDREFIERLQRDYEKKSKRILIIDLVTFIVLSTTILILTTL